MKDTIVRDKKAYMAFAIRVGKSKSQSELLKLKLARLLPDARLYDAQRLVAQFKDIYTRVWEQHSKGNPPEHVDIELSVRAAGEAIQK
jgi:predicted O-linked N-acetylglucosamine transferase (SPINDLY family)